MTELRWILIFVGLVVIGVVYWIGRRSKSAPDDLDGLARLEPRFDTSRAPGTGSFERHAAPGDEALDAHADTGYEPVSPAAGQPDADAHTLPGVEWAPDEETLGGSGSAAGDQKIFALRLVSRDPQGFGGADVLRVLRDEDLRFGRFEIFHRLYKNNDDEIVFSVASLTEPGSFDLSTLESMRLRGLSFFMVMPGPQDGGAAFADMLATARRVAEGLQGELQDQTGSTLSAQRAATLREEVIQYQYQTGLSQLSENH